jgi:hypothetical protein
VKAGREVPAKDGFQNIKITGEPKQISYTVPLKGVRVDLLRAGREGV